MGLYISFAGMVTYKNAQTCAMWRRRCRSTGCLIETDCPYLAPVPVRGQRNEPAFVAHTAACLAGVRGIPVETLARQTTANAHSSFLASGGRKPPGYVEWSQPSCNQGLTPHAPPQADCAGCAVRRGCNAARPQKKAVVRANSAGEVRR